MTKEQKRLSQINHDKAAEYYCLQSGWVLHHIDPTWKTEDVERYIQWNVEDLVMMTRSDHQTWHMHHLPQSYHDTMSEACSGEKNGFYGKKHSEDAKRKMREAAKRRGKHWHVVNGKRVWED